MLLFCPICSNLLKISLFDAAYSHSGGGNRLECRSCAYQSAIVRPIYSRREFARREREDVVGGAAAWENAQKTKITCAKDGCPGQEAAFYTVQIRSADEPMTEFYKCMHCGHSWRQNG